MIVDLAVSLFAITVILFSLLPLFRHDAWWIRGFEFPRIQVTLLSVAALFGYVLLNGWREAQDRALIGILVVCIVFQLARIARYTPLFAKQVKSTPSGLDDDEHTLSVLLSNVLTPNRNAQALVELVRERRPDVVLAVETDKWWESQLAVLEDDYPYSVKHPLDNLYGMHLFSRLELIDPQVMFLVEDEVPSIHTQVVLRSGHRVAMHCLHPAPPSPTENPTSAERDAELLLMAKKIDSRDRPTDRSVVVMGDLNDVAWSSTTRMFQNISGLLDPRIGRGMYSTFHADWRLLRWPLDHVFCSPDFTVSSLQRLPHIGSDHFPMHVVLRHTPAVQAEHESLRADDAERELAREKIDKVVSCEAEKIGPH